VDDRTTATVQQTRPDRGARIADLMSAARQGSEDALGQIVTELSPLLWQVARAAGLNSNDAEDVLQTAWLRLVAHLDGIHDSAALTGWLVTTTRREA
jgi:DNA-directed RNA polymerase specialized sigma24 family protein